MTEDLKHFLELQRIDMDICEIRNAGGEKAHLINDLKVRRNFLISVISDKNTLNYYLLKRTKDMESKILIQRGFAGCPKCGSIEVKELFNRTKAIAICPKCKTLLYDYINSLSALGRDNEQVYSDLELINKVIQKRNIKVLVHFTHINNLPSILKYGIVQRSILEKHRKKFVYNDEKRIDGFKNASCLSISFPNYRYFCNLHKKQPNNWVVIELKPCILTELRCAFYETNAANKMFLGDRISEPRDFVAFEKMFYRNANRKVISKSMTTDPQAEVLVFNRIRLKYIISVNFQSRFVISERDRMLLNQHKIDFQIQPKYFKPRDDYAFWRQSRLEEYDG